MMEGGRSPGLILPWAAPYFGKLYHVLDILNARRTGLPFRPTQAKPVLLLSKLTDVRRVQRRTVGD